MPVPGFALGYHRTGRNIQDGKQGGGAVADVVVGDALDVAQTHAWATAAGCDLGAGSAFSRQRRAPLPYRAN